MPARLAALTLALLLCLPGTAAAAPGWRWPLRGEVLTPFRNGADPYARGQHRGIDIAGRPGAAVAAATGGRVRFAGTAGNSGLTVSIRTADGRYDTSYLHLSATAVRPGQAVAAGQRVGAVGTSGRRSASAPHLHFGVRDAGSRHRYHDPMDLLPPVAPGAPRGTPPPVPLRRPVAVSPEPAPAHTRVRGHAPLPSARLAGATAAGRLGVPGRARVRVTHRSALPGPMAARRGRAADGRAALGPPPERRRAQRPPEAVRPGPFRRPRDAAGPDLGWVLACLGLLGAAACLGGPGSAERRRGGSLRTIAGPLLGRR